ncbi:hypothetical protein GCM10020221_20980 [Streptomyces thioluteus]|uniref:ABC-2 type transporter domain-containing protein n=1 Tax=Streptomyces thioluteus TaxID=66431 RepID=A0ABN3WQM5_STRTU
MKTLIQLEIARTLRNKKFMFFSVLYPAALYLLIAAGSKDTEKIGDTGLTFPVIYMVSMATFGAITSVLIGNAERIAKEREKGWGAPAAPDRAAGPRLCDGEGRLGRRGCRCRPSWSSSSSPRPPRASGSTPGSGAPWPP